MHSELTAGVARVDITPPLPIDIFGTARQWRPAERVLEPLTATALVLTARGWRLVLVGADLGYLSQSCATEIREQIAKAVGTEPNCVMINVSHTHAAPHTSLAPVKVGGDVTRFSQHERAYIDYLPRQLVSAAVQAARRQQPVRIGGRVLSRESTASRELTVNRRERTLDGNTIIGCNWDGPCDRDLGVLRVDRLDGKSIAVVVNFACHPVVLMADPPLIGPDFVGPMRRKVEAFTGAPCLFLQGAGGNVMPVEALFPEPGPETDFGIRLAADVIAMWAGIETQDVEFTRTCIASISRIAVYRAEARTDQEAHSLAAASERVDLSLDQLPAKSELEGLLARHLRDYDAAVETGQTQGLLNPLAVRAKWAEYALRTINNGEASIHLQAIVHAFRIGDVSLIGVPCEPFSEMSFLVKERSSLRTVFFCGYTNGVIAYIPSAAEFSRGGYEVNDAHQTYGLLGRVDASSEDKLVGACLRVLGKANSPSQVTK